MDPNAALANARAITTAILSGWLTEDGGYELAEAFDALDQWLTKGGFLPSAWAR